MKKFINSVWDWAKVILIALAIVIPVRYFLFQPFFVRGESMSPNFENGDYLIVDEISYRLRAPERGEVIVFHYPENPSQLFIKRIIGLPGETIAIKDNKITVEKDGNTKSINESAYLSPSLYTSGDMRITLGSDEYFVMGDNRPYSYDSRRFGVLKKSEIIGKVFLRTWPLTALGAFKLPSYN